jgi:dTDP-glucose 4,6-dehydratase
VKIKFVKDRPGHDLRYALDSSKIYKKLKWKPSKRIEVGLSETFKWYFNNYNFFNFFSKKIFFKRLGTNL